MFHTAIFFSGLETKGNWYVRHTWCYLLHLGDNNFWLWGNDIRTIKFWLLSAYEVKNNCCLFERLFKVKKSGVFLFGISFFVLEIFTFLYYANEESDDVTDRSTKMIKYWIKNISRNIEAVIFKLGTRNVHHKRNKMAPAILLPWQHPWFQSLSV